MKMIIKLDNKLIYYTNHICSNLIDKINYLK